jgi:hypothetical protein
VAETTVKKLLCCGFRHTGKAMGQLYECWWEICREINVIPRFEYHMFYVLYPFMTYVLALPRNSVYSYPLHVSSLFLCHLHVEYTVNHLNHHAIHPDRTWVPFLYKYRPAGYVS